MVDTGGQRSHPTEEKGLPEYVVPDGSGGSCKVLTCLKGCSLCYERQSSGRSSEKIWRRTLGLHQGTSGKPSANSGGVRTLLTSTETVIGWWKEHFEELLNPTMPSMIEAGPEADGDQINGSQQETNGVLSPGRD